MDAIITDLFSYLRFASVSADAQYKAQTEACADWLTQRFQRAGLIASRGTSREERRPERTVYEATEEGRRALRSWVRRGLSTPAREFPEFPAALSTLYGVDGPDDLRTLLEFVAAGRLKPVIDRVLSLEETAEAERLLEDREVFGKVLIKP